MKTLCVAVVLSLISVCRPASLACEKLVKPIEKGPDLSGRWYFIAMSSELCFAPILFNVLFWPSIAVDIVAKDTLNVYEGDFKGKMYGYCLNESESFLYVNGSISDVNENYTPTGDPDVLLQTGCSDCFVIKGVGVIDTLMLFSKRKVVSAAELKEFEEQGRCLGWSKPQIFNTDHDYENCRSLDEDMSEEEAEHFVKNVFPKIYERVKTMYPSVLECMTGTVYSYFSNSIF